MKLGFTGTHLGMTENQKDQVRIIFEDLKPEEFHHGDCIGADAEAHKIALSLNIPVVIHPPSNPAKRAFCGGSRAILPPDEYLSRNKSIVRSTEVLIATPFGYHEEQRSGTWSTIRFAKKWGFPVFIVFPDGVVGRV